MRAVEPRRGPGVPAQARRSGGRRDRTCGVAGCPARHDSGSWTGSWTGHPVRHARKHDPEGTEPPHRVLVTYDGITVDPELVGGAPTVRGLRIPVATVVSMVADGVTVEEICTDLPDLTPEDVAEALRYAASGHRRRLAADPPTADRMTWGPPPTDRRMCDDRADGRRGARAARFVNAPGVSSRGRVDPAQGASDPEVRTRATRGPATPLQPAVGAGLEGPARSSAASRTTASASRRGARSWPPP